MQPERQPSLWEEVEDGLGSIGKLRILRVMLGDPNRAFTKYALEKLTRLKPVDVRANLKTLIKLGWIKELQYQPKKYRANLNNEIVKRILPFFQNIEHL